MKGVQHRPLNTDGRVGVLVKKNGVRSLQARPRVSDSRKLCTPDSGSVVATKTNTAMKTIQQREPGERKSSNTAATLVASVVAKALASSRNTHDIPETTLSSKRVFGARKLQVTSVR